MAANLQAESRLIRDASKFTTMKGYVVVWQQYRHCVHHQVSYVESVKSEVEIDGNKKYCKRATAFL